MVDKGVHFEDAVREFEKRFIVRVLSAADGSLTKTADTLGIHRNTLSRKMGEYKIKRGRTGWASGQHLRSAQLGHSPLDTANRCTPYNWQSLYSEC